MDLYKIRCLASLVFLVPRPVVYTVTPGFVKFIMWNRYFRFFLVF